MSEQLLELYMQKEIDELETTGSEQRPGISDIEARHLQWLASQVPMGGAIVEIGSYRGKSTCAMGCACLLSGNHSVKIWAVDLWTLGGSKHHRYHTEETWKIFNEQVEKMGLKSIIKPVMMDSRAAAHRRRHPIDLLFIDGDHRYKGVRQDYLLWNPFIPKGGRIAFHDYNARFPGVTQMIDEILIPSGLWADFHTYDRIFSAVRL
jgi:predicted O-methyltransferase YrrM